MAKPKYETYKHIGVVGILSKTDDEVPMWYIDVDGDTYLLEDILSQMKDELIEIKCDF